MVGMSAAPDTIVHESKTMNRPIKTGFSALILAIACASAASASEPSAKEIRDEFGHSKHQKLRLAAEALGDDSLLQFFKKVQNDPDADPRIREILRRLMGR